MYKTYSKIKVRKCYRLQEVTTTWRPSDNKQCKPVMNSQIISTLALNVNTQLYSYIIMLLLAT